MVDTNSIDDIPVQERLIKAALTCFLADDYRRVTTRQIAEMAGANAAMIHYYFGNKEGLYEEMIRQTLQPLLDTLDSDLLATTDGLAGYFRLYYRTMLENPHFPALELKVLALNQGPGKRFIQQLLEQGRNRAGKKIDDFKKKGLIDEFVDSDQVRIAFISMAMMPMLLKPILEEQMGRELDWGFFDQLAEQNGRLLAAGLKSTEQPDGKG